MNIKINTTTSIPRLFHALFCLFLLTAILFTYRSQISRPLEDDTLLLVTHNSFNQAGISGLPKMWTSAFFSGGITGTGFEQKSGYYRPVTNTMYWLEYQFTGATAVVYNFDQQALHWINCCLAYFLMLALGTSRAAAVAAAILFAVHPINAFAATDVASRSDTLFCAFYLAAIIVYIKAVFHDRPVSAAKIGLAVMLYGLSIMSKEMGATLPAMLVALHVYFYYRMGAPIRTVKNTVPFWLALAAYLALRFMVIKIPPQNVGYNESFGAVIVYMNAVKNVAIYLFRIAIPLGADYPELDPALINIIDPELKEPLIYISIAVIGLISYFAVAYRKRAPAPAFFAAGFLIAMTPLVSVNSITGSMAINIIPTQERWAYLPGLFVFMAAGYGVMAFYNRLSSRRSRLICFAAFCAAGIMLSHGASVHAVSIKGWFPLLRWLYLYPEDRPIARTVLANREMLYARLVAEPSGRFAEAEGRAREAVKILPESAFAAVNLAAILGRQNKWDEVIEILSPWKNPAPEVMLEKGRTHNRAIDDLNRSHGEISRLMDEARKRTGK